MIMRSMRDNLHILKIFFWILLVVLAVGLVLPGAKLGREQANAAMLVDGNAVPSARYSRSLSSQLEEARQNAGGELTEAESRKVRHDVAERMIEEELSVAHALDLGQSISPQEFQQAVFSDPSFKDEKGAFDQRRYEQLLSQQVAAGVSVDEAEAAFQRGMLLQKVRIFWSNQALLSPAELKKAQDKLNRQVRVQALVWQTSKLQSSVKLSDEDLHSYYSKNRQKWVVPEEVKVRQILVRTEFGGSTATVKAKAQAIKAKLSGGADFKVLAKTENADKAASDNAGELGWLKREDFRSPALAGAALALKEGQVSEVIETSEGFHLLKVEGKKKGFDPTFDGSKAKVVAELGKERAAKEAAKLARVAIKKMKEGAKAEALAKELGAQLVTSSWFDRDAKEPLPMLGDAKGLARGLLYLDKDEVSPSPALTDKGAAVAVIREEKPGSAPKKPQDAQARLQDAAEQARVVKAQALYEGWVASLRKTAEVKDQVGALN